MGYRTTRRQLKKAKPAAKQREYLFSGTVELRGVWFVVQASSDEEAREKAKAGEYIESDYRGAECVNWEMNPNTMELNE
jgi:hypothetical protein